MNETIAKFITPESCEQFALNVEANKPELAKEARRRAVELCAADHHARTDVEREALQAVYAYERAQAHLKKRAKFYAIRTWRMIETHGIVPGFERVLTRTDDAAGYRVLVEMGMEDMAFEAVVVRHPGSFSPEAVAASKERLDRLRAAPRE